MTAMGRKEDFSADNFLEFWNVGIHVWTPFNKLGRIYGKEIRERAKKSASSFVHKIREIGTTIYPWLLWQVSLSTAKPATKF